ncbi:MAG TPA: efflux transporter outer membrane subunit [Steroidobacteraceae bacterium]|nr:efflux transporter outer membrane subunit [Steroidobacteraceae bacterium]
MTPSRLSVIAALGTVLGGCMVGPNYHRASAPVAGAYQEQPPQGWAKAAPSDAAPKGDWWRDFHDPLLDELEPHVAVSNQTVRQDYANYLQAVAEVKVARAQLFPTLGLTGSVTRLGGPGYSGTSVSSPTTTGTATTGTGAAGSVGVRGGSVTSATLEGTASWTLDIWGQVRRLIEENAAIAQSEEATLANATLSEQTLLATTVIELRVADANIELEEKTVKAYRDALHVTQAQGRAGITATPPSAVITAQVALETAQASLIGLGVARAQYAHAIAVLVGKKPEDLDVPRSTTLPTLPVIPVGVPSTLLERRPDIAAAERTMKAQNAAIGVAVAAYYPTISLSAAGGFTQSPLNGLLHSANHIWSLGANGTETLFDFGERHAEVQAARAAYEAAVASYRSTVLTAFEDVENDLSGLRILDAQSKALDTAVHDAIRGTDIALAEFKAGTVDYTTVAQAQEVQLSDQQTALAVQESRLADAVSLIGDLGGGWSARDLHSPWHPKSLPSDPSESPPPPPPKVP